MKIATIAVYVENQGDALRFWTEKVGFVVHRTQPMGPEASWIEVGPPGAGSCLVLYPKSMMEDWAERKPSVVFEVDDLDRLYGEMSSRGVVFQQPPQDMPWGPFAIFLDPRVTGSGSARELRQKRDCPTSFQPGPFVGFGRGSTDRIASENRAYIGQGPGICLPVPRLDRRRWAPLVRPTQKQMKHAAAA